MEPNPFKIPPRIVQECRDNPTRLTNIDYREGYSPAGLIYYLARQMEEATVFPAGEHAAEFAFDAK